MELNDFVERNFGSDAARLLKNIRKGGDNNEKGSGYERSFTAHKIIEAWSQQQQDAEKIIFVLQDLAFVDDLAITDHSVNAKVNYQAKNSNTQAAAYTDEMHQRFTMQAQIDQDYFRIKNPKQVLLVSCDERCRANNQAITSKLKGTTQIGSFTSEFFPYATEQMDLFEYAQNLRTNICAIINKNDLSSIDNAFRLVIGAMDGRSKFSLQEVIDKARELAKPDLFVHFGQNDTVPPAWLVDMVNAFDNVELVVKSRDFYVTCNGFEVRVSVDMAEPSAEQLAIVTKAFDLFALLMTLATQEFKVEQEEV
ncbi:hypothetical protein [Arsukibacterium sp.]|uniref:hypothetical protein n=1 Tax=Arsukibacterium sp. TaxID=1977258 RepID=UPI001BD668C5|nr:hypothetical protein [Arsukibacterium sp.]